MHQRLEGYHLHEYMQTAGAAITSDIASSQAPGGASTSAHMISPPAVTLGTGGHEGVPDGGHANASWQTIPDLQCFSLADLLQHHHNSSTLSIPSTYDMAAPPSVWNAGTGLAGSNMVTKLEPIESTLQLQAGMPSGLHLGMLSLASQSLPVQPQPVRGPAAAAAALGASVSLTGARFHSAGPMGTGYNGMALPNNTSLLCDAPATMSLGATTGSSSMAAGDIKRAGMPTAVGMSRGSLLHQQMLGRTVSDASMQSHTAGMLVNGVNTGANLVNAGVTSRPSSNPQLVFGRSGSRPGSGDTSQHSPALCTSSQPNNSQGSYPSAPPVGVTRTTSGISHLANSSLQNLTINGGSAPGSAVLMPPHQQLPDSCTLASLMFRSALPTPQLSGGGGAGGATRLGVSNGIGNAGGANAPFMLQQQQQRLELQRGGLRGVEDMWGMGTMGAQVSEAHEEPIAPEYSMQSLQQLQMQYMGEGGEMGQVHGGGFSGEQQQGGGNRDKATKRGRYGTKVASSLEVMPRTRGPRRRLRHQILDVEAMLAAHRDQVAVLELEQAELRLRARVLEHAVTCRAEQVAHLRAAAAAPSTQPLQRHETTSAPATQQPAAGPAPAAVRSDIRAEVGAEPQSVALDMHGSYSLRQRLKLRMQLPAAGQPFHPYPESAPSTLEGSGGVLAAPLQQGVEPMETQEAPGEGMCMPLSCPTSLEAVGAAAVLPPIDGDAFKVRPGSDTSTSGFSRSTSCSARPRSVRAGSESAAAVAAAQGLPLIGPSFGTLLGGGSTTSGTALASPAPAMSVRAEEGEGIKQEVVQVEHGYGTRRARRGARGANATGLVTSLSLDPSGTASASTAPAATTTSVGATTTVTTGTTTLGVRASAGQVEGPLVTAGSQVLSGAPAPPVIGTAGTVDARHARLAWLESQIAYELSRAGVSVAAHEAAVTASADTVGHVRSLFGDLHKLATAKPADVLLMYRRAASSLHHVDGSATITAVRTGYAAEAGSDEGNGRRTRHQSKAQQTPSQAAAAHDDALMAEQGAGEERHSERRVLATHTQADAVAGGSSGAGRRLTWGELVRVLPVLHTANPNSLLVLGAPLSSKVPLHLAPGQHWLKVAGALQLAPSQVEELAMLGEVVGSAWERQTTMRTCVMRALSDMVSSGGTHPGPCHGGTQRTLTELRALQVLEAAQSLAIAQWSTLLLAADVVLTRVLSSHQVAQLMVLSFPCVPDPLGIMHAAWEAVRMRPREMVTAAGAGNSM